MYAVSFCNPNPIRVIYKGWTERGGVRDGQDTIPRAIISTPSPLLVLVHLLSKDHIQQCLYKIPHPSGLGTHSFQRSIYNNIVRIITTINYKQNLSPITEGVLMHNTTQSSKNKGHAICFLGIVKTFLARIS